MSGVHIPGLDQLPPGPLRTLTESLHELYHAAGMPSLRQIARAVTDDNRFSDTVSHEKVSAMLHGSGLPKWSKLQPVVVTLAQWSTPPRTISEEVQRFKLLWDAAALTHLSDPPSGLPRTRPQSRLRSAFVLGGVTGETKSPDYEGAILNQFCRNLGATIAEADVDLIVCSPFPDSADFYALSGYLESGLGRSVHLHMPRHEVVERQYDQLREVLGPDAVDRIRLWHYPGPETASRDALEQAWLLCQLMAMEKARGDHHRR